MSDNIILFPKGKKGSPPQTIEEMMEEINFARTEKIDIILQDLIPLFMSMIGDAGIDIFSDKCGKENALVFESIKALLYKAYDLDHPLHVMSDRIFEMAQCTDSGISYKYDYDNHEEELSPG